MTRVRLLVDLNKTYSNKIFEQTQQFWLCEIEKKKVISFPNFMAGIGDKTI